MKKQNLKNLSLNKRAISNINSTGVQGGLHSGLEVTCPNFCRVTQDDGALCQFTKDNGPVCQNNK